MKPGRSFFLAGVLAAACAAILLAPASAQRVAIGQGSIVEAVARLKPGEYVWAPQVAPAGPVLVVVNRATQRAMIFRNGVPIGASTVSTGRPGYETPTGVFSILQKHVEHYSSTYDNAPMPFMQRLTWRGVALHAGKLPGYPASHGCIRLPFEFAQLLYGVTRVGMTVVIIGHAASPRLAPAPKIDARDPALAAEPMEWRPELAPTGPVSIVVSASDGRAFVIRNGIIIGSAPVSVAKPVTGTWAYALRSGSGSGAAGNRQWIRLDLSKEGADKGPVPAEEWARFTAAAEFKQRVGAILVPGSTIIVTADSLRTGSPAAPLTVIEAGREDWRP